MKIETLMFALAISIILVSGILYGVYYYTTSVNECTKNPFVYGAKTMESYNDAKFVGSGRYMADFSPTYSFNSTDLTILQPIKV